MTDKIGVFICTGYGIAEALDIDALSKVATDEFNVPFCKTVDSCEGPGLASMNADIENEGLGKVLVAGISPRLYSDDAFPEGPFLDRGYHCSVHGQRTYNGVAVLTKAKPASVQRTFEGDPIPEQARVLGRNIAFHDCSGPVTLASSTHLALACPNVVEQEITRAFYYGWYHELVDTPPPIDDGAIRTPPGPGLGLALQPGLEQRPDAIRRVTSAS